MRSNTHGKATSKFENQLSSPVNRMRGRKGDCRAVFLSRIENRELEFLQLAVSPIESCPPQIHMSKPRSRSVRVFGGGVFGRWLGLDEVLEVGPHGGISARVRDLCSLSAV